MMTKHYLILSSDELKTTYTFIAEEIISTMFYTLLDDNDEILFTAENHGNGIKFGKKIGKSFDYAEIADLKLFLNLIHEFDSGLKDTFEVYEKITTV